MVRERFERCLDLYLCPRSFKRKLAIDPATLVPKLADPKDLRPFPTARCVTYVAFFVLKKDFMVIIKINCFARVAQVRWARFTRARHRYQP